MNALKRAAVVGVLAGATMVAVAGMASAAPADTTGNRGDGISILSNACVLPWHWDGPLNIGTGGNSTSYVACNGNSAGDSHHGLSILDNLCVAPWYWEGPGNLLNLANTTEYIACNGNES